ncbi:hypothetical protein [Jatrophihabitans lederbergiae]|uniref:Uncharacterized protein n=1 Tax=Jatrophihabitans lederbergiae TaxID=3075547 RepID=A0ABU2J9Q5_9ACTN|nr:hypothetical protein [Jatrophihabitans sp. DSM 44399]MDT0261697.1 hypothetical protein [Jatrophihabitans sp. DSM 44399]
MADPDVAEADVADPDVAGAGRPISLRAPVLCRLLRSWACAAEAC